MGLAILEDLVEEALADFEELGLAVATRRTYRIARLRGDVRMAHRLWLEIRPAGGAPEDRVETLGALYPGLDYEALAQKHRTILEEHLKARAPVKPRDKEIYMSGSVGELEIQLQQSVELLREAEADGYLDPATRLELRQSVAERREVLDRLKVWVMDYLVSAELEMQASDPIARAFAIHRRRVDQVLSQVAPGIGDQLQAAVRAARHGDDEARAQVLLTCRRVLVAAANELYPSSKVPHVSADGKHRPVGEGQYRNRILAGVEKKSTVGKAFAASIGELAARLDQLDELTQKGVHADVSENEMSFGLAQTYLLVGELIASDSTPPSSN